MANYVALWAGFLLLLTHGVYCAVPLVDLCRYTNKSVASGSLLANVTIRVSASSTTKFPSYVWPNVTGSVRANGMQIDLMFDVSNSSASIPDVTIEKTLEMFDSSRKPPLVFIRSAVHHKVGSPSSSIDSVVITEKLKGTGLLASLGDGFKPGIYDPNLTHSKRVTIMWSQTNVTPGESRTIEYYAEPGGEEGRDLKNGVTHYSTDVSFTDAYGVKFGPIHAEVCIKRRNNPIYSVFYQHGFTALSFFLAFILGILLVILIACICIRILRKRGLMGTSVSPSKTDEKRLKEKGKKIMMDAKAALKKGLNTIKDFSLIGLDESIVFILALKDKLQMFREVDNLDILSTIHVDTDIEKEQNDASVQATILLIQGLRFNNDISKQLEDKAMGDLNTRLKDLDKKLQEDYRKEVEEVYKDLSAKNKEKFSDLMRLHREQRVDILSKTKDSPDEERKAVLTLLEQQQQTEENELTYILALEQNEEAEKLRKEFAIRKRMGIKEVQQSVLNDLINQGRLAQEQADWILKEHYRQQEAIHRMYDEEISRQRMILEEKLARRRALAHSSEAQEDDHSDMLNTMASHQINAIQKMKKQGVLSPADAEEYMAKVKEEMLAIKDKMDKEKERQEAELHKKLSLLKQQRMAEKKRQQEAEVQDSERSKTQQTEGPVDPVQYVEGLLQLNSNHRLELSNLENTIDAEHSEELQTARNGIAAGVKIELQQTEQTLMDNLMQEGMTESQMQKLLKQHKKNMAELEALQQAERQKQETRLKEELDRRKREWTERKASEKREQEELREHEAKVVKKLINSQVSISEEERQKIIKEHEKQMVKLENSLTLNKLRQKRMLEERLAQKRNEQMEKLQQKQQKEMATQRRVAENNGEESDEESHRLQVSLLKKHAEQRIAVLQGQKLDLEDELDQIRLEMTKERALALKDQEERLGAMIASLQMQKARELAKIEEQQTAINNLKANLMDDLTERGILTNPECQRILDKHKSEQEQLNKKLESQRAKQEKIMRQKLNDRLQQRENSLVQNQEREMQKMIQASSNKTAAKIRRMLLMHKQMVELEQFRNQMDREMSQTVEDTKQQYEVNKLRIMQEQELQFIAGLVRVGKIPKEDLVHVLHMLFPGKTEEAIKLVLDKIYDQTLVPPPPQAPGTEDSDFFNSSMTSNLAERIRSSQLSNLSPSRSGSLRSNQGKQKKRLGSGKKRQSSVSFTSNEDINDNGYIIGTYGDARKLSTANQGSQPGYHRNSGFEEDGYPTGVYGEPKRKFSAKRGSVAGYGYNEPIVEEDYGHSRGGNHEVDYVGMGAGLDEYTPNSTLQRRLPPLEPVTQPRGKKKKKLLKRLAKKDDGESPL